MDAYFEKYDALANKLGIDALTRLLPRPCEGTIQLRAEVAAAKDIATALPRRVAQIAEKHLAGTDAPRTPEEWRVLVAADEHLNNVELTLWDLRHDAVSDLARLAALRDGDKSYTTSLSSTVSVLKHVARYYATRERAAST